MEDSEYVKQCIEINPLALTFAHASTRQRLDKEKLVECIQCHNLCMMYGHEELKKEPDVIREAVETRMGPISGLPWVALIGDDLLGKEKKKKKRRGSAGGASQGSR